MHECFEPIIDKNSEILILGSLPGPESLRQNEYYAHRFNQFWTIMHSILNEKPTENYVEKCDLLLKNRIALWDVYACANRTGAADSNIKNSVVNDFEALFRKYPRIKGIVFNGDTAERILKRDYPQIFEKFVHVKVPSSSTARAMRLESKTALWRKEFGEIKKAIERTKE